MANRKYEYPVDSLHAYRTKFSMDHSLKGSFNHGEFVPFDVIEVLPGDTFKIDLATIVRMSTPIAPIMDNIHMFVSAWFVPNRLVYDNWEQLMGANKDGAWITDEGSYVTPYVTDINIPSPASVGYVSIGDYMGLPVGTGYTNKKINALPARAYALIWNENFRSEVVSAPLPIDHSANNRVLVDNYVLYPETSETSDVFSIDGYTSKCLPLGKFSDYFTKALPQPIKHDPIPFIPDALEVGYPYDSTYSTSQSSVIVPAVTAGDAGFNQLVTGAGAGGKELVASVNASWNTIEAIRVAFQVDKFYWKDGAYGSRYWEILEGHFKVTNKQGVLQLPQKLGEMRFRINVDQVLSTAGYSADDSTTVGAPGANSVTTAKGSLFTFSATEHGFIIIVGGCRHDHTYGQGFSKMWTRSDRLDYYDPVFANIGEQPVMSDELVNSASNVIFGYQEAWAEYRYIPDRVCGILRPNVTGSLDFWTLSDKFDAVPLLNPSFIYENRNSLARALVTGSSGPDYIFDMYFKATAVREMPLFSIPGLADHH